ncbi:MAG: hypothetical protein GY702_06395 [Desulfobulbaceae bacterium]|nr:hypothetical protein [Desulfobulbaceae bacterium]
MESPPQLTLYRERCLRSRLNTNKCQRCIEVCSSGALSVNNRKIVLDVARCTGCMSCVAACPQDAVTSDFDLDKMLNSFRTGHDIFVSCIRQEQIYPDEITLPCVGILSKEVLTAVILCGCRTVSFNVAGCGRCRNYDISNTFQGNCKQIFEELSESLLTKVTLIDKKEHLPKAKVDRRSFLTKILDTAINVPKQRFLSKRATPVETQNNRRRIPFKTNLLKKVLTNVDQISQQKIHRLFDHNLVVSEECNCCPLCKGICPTGAIKIVHSAQIKRLKFTKLDCNGCGLCVEFCKKNALSFES